VGSHKPNSAVPQAYYNKREGVKRLTTETGAGQWGSALSLATSKFGLECKVYMVRVSYDQKPYRKFIMQTYGAQVVASPSMDTNTGRAILAKDPDTPGSLGMAISEALEDAATHDDTNYALGSVLNHVVLHQSIIGLEAKKQMEIAGEYPDVIIGCCGGGSNFAGLLAPFVPDYLEGKKIEFIGYEPASCPSMTGGKLAYDSGDVAMMTPLLYMYTLGHDFVPPGIHAGGLRYHGMAPIISAWCATASSLPRQSIRWSVSRPASSSPNRGHHSGTGNHPRHPRGDHRGDEGSQGAEDHLFQFLRHRSDRHAAYDNYLSGKLSDYAYPQEQIDASLARLPKVG
jgi:tryptophan synthase beta chain